MLSIMCKDTGESVKCSIVGEPSLYETMAALEGVVKVLRICMPNAPEAAISALMGSVVAKSLTEEGADNE